MIPRISPADLDQRMRATVEPVLIVDARLKYPFEHSTVMLPTARRAPPGGPPPDLPARAEVVVYDSDPDELAAEAVAMGLARQGHRASVLAGGIAAWMAAKLPVDSKPAPRLSVPMRGA